MSDNTRVYDLAETMVIRDGKSSESFAFQFIGALSGVVDSKVWNDAIDTVLTGMGVTA